MSIAKLMNDRRAADIYASLDTHIHPITLADDYQLAKLADDKSMCLALEYFVRDLARMHFHRTEVRDALAQIERAKSRRKMGTGAPKPLQDVARQIEVMYSVGDYDSLEDGRIKFYVVVGGEACDRNYLKVTCRNSPGAVALVVAKYRRGIRKGDYGTHNR